MKRSELLARAGYLAAAAVLSPRTDTQSSTASAWPSEKLWARLERRVGGNLLRVRSPFDVCRRDPSGAACAHVFQSLSNPYSIGDDPALTQTSGWLDAWTSSPSVYAVAARHADDVAAAINFAREHRVRLVVKGGGHSYQGTSNAPSSLLVWTRRMNEIMLHDAFVPKGCGAVAQPVPAVSVEAGAIWFAAYDAVTTKGGRYVQGGGCTTVGVAGLVSSGGFGSFSKHYGTAASWLLEAEIVTADGKIRTVNACSDPELFWALKGGGGGTFGVITRLTLRTHDLDDRWGGANFTVKANSDRAFQRLLARFVTFYRSQLFNDRWGEQAHFTPHNELVVSMVFRTLDGPAARAIWAPFLDWLAASPGDYRLTSGRTSALCRRSIGGTCNGAADTDATLSSSIRVPAPRRGTRGGRAMAGRLAGSSMASARCGCPRPYWATSSATVFATRSL
ncbi:MAG: FAD-dependent oxidoreductase [Candidatus Cybelea sp.]